MSNVNDIETRALPVLALRGLNIFPGMLLNFDVERPISVAALNSAMNDDQEIFLVTQKDIATDMPEERDLYRIGVVCRIRQMIRQPGSKLCKVMVEGVQKGAIVKITSDTPHFLGEIELMPNKIERGESAKKDALMRTCIGMFDEYLQLAGNLPPEMLLNIVVSRDPGYVADYIAHNLRIDYRDKQRLLEELHPLKRLEMLMSILSHEIEVMTIEQELNDATNEQMNRNQREYFLREQMKVIQQELGEDDTFDDIGEYRRKIRALKLDSEIEEKLLKEVSHLAKQPFGSTEATVIRGYLDTCLELPWNTKTVETDDIELARKMLDEDHFGLEKVKERVIEYLAVRKLAPKASGILLCLVGPPGTGKTSIAMSIARATNRNLVRISLGGVHDEAEIRGHRKTYVGSMPGRIIGGIKHAKSSNPLMVLDEVDKLGSDYRGDPSAALLEALDPEQNKTFRDNFLEVPYDLSDVFFITTANTTDTIPRALLDRMDIIELSSYTDEEKLCIAKNHLLPKQRKKHGLKAAQLKISDDAIREIISLYTRESGVRGLERQIGTICRKTAVAITNGERKSLSLRAGMLKPYLGAEKFKPEKHRNKDEIGLVHGLAWTSVGGEVLDVEVAVVDGSGKLELTGNLGNVMKESCQAAVTYIRSRAKALGIDEQFYKNKDIHIHFPEGAVPKDGPSAGITVCTAIVSALTGRAARRDIAMTGEISLRGRVLPIGGLKEKTMAALRNGINTVIIPTDNEPDLDEIDPTVKAALNFVLADSVDKVIDVALLGKGDEATSEIKTPRTRKRASSDIRQ
ncbi:MAG: endopeptidase La [Oscillospiraceae bacterium]|nr:endopeptidase La [Oscillospiraceae bacterium]